MSDATTAETTTEVVEDTKSMTTPKDVADRSTASAASKGETNPDPAGAEALGDPGKKALDTMKAERQAAREETRQAKAALDAALAKIAGTEAEHTAQVERQRVQDEAMSKANDRIRKAEVRAAAAGVLTDPADALLYLDLSGFEVGDDGEVDQAAIKAAIEDLAKKKPYLAAQGGGTGTVFESPGAHRKGAIGQLTQADLKGMTPAQINTARAEGRLNDLLGFKN